MMVGMHETTNKKWGAPRKSVTSSATKMASSQRNSPINIDPGFFQEFWANEIHMFLLTSYRIWYIQMIHSLITISSIFCDETHIAFHILEKVLYPQFWKDSHIPISYALRGYPPNARHFVSSLNMAEHLRKWIHQL
jgi:hypothetical protein